MSGALQFSSGRQLGSAFVRVRPETSGFGVNLAKQLQQAFRSPSFDSVFKIPVSTGVDTTWAATAGHMERGARASSIIASNITRAFGAPLALGAALVGKISADFEYTLNTVRAVSGATLEQAEALEKAARAAALGTKFTAQQVAEAQQFLALAGNDVTDILAALPSVLTLAAAGNLELGRAADIVTNIMAGQGRTIDQLAESVDVLTATFTGSNTNLEQLGTAFAYVGPVAHAIGIQFVETSAAIGLLGNAGIQASVAGTTLRGALSKLVAPTRVGTQVLQRLGVVTTDTEGKLLPLADIIGQFETKGLTAADAMRLFGQRAGPGMLTLVEQGSDALKRFTAELELSGGTAQEIADIQLEGLRGAFLIAKSQFEEFALAFSDSGLGKDLQSLIKHIGNFFEALSDDKALQNLIKNVSLVTFTFVAAGRVLGGAGGLIARLVGLRSALSAVQSLGTLREVFNLSTSTPQQIAQSSEGLAEARVNIENARNSLRNLAASLTSVAILTAAAVAAGNYLWDRYQNSLSRVQELTKEFAGTLETDLVGGFDGVGRAGEETFSKIREELDKIDISLSALQTDRLVQGITGSDDAYERAAIAAQLLDSANEDARKSVEDLRRGFLRAQAEILAYNVELGVAIDFNSAFGESSDRLTAFLNEVAGAADSAKLSFGSFAYEVITFTFGTSTTNKINNVREALRGVNAEIANSDAIQTGSREDVIETYKEIVNNSEEVQNSFKETAGALQFIFDSIEAGDRGYRDIVANLTEIEQIDLTRIIGQLGQAGFELGNISQTDAEKLVEILTKLDNTSDVGSIRIGDADIELIRDYARTLEGLNDILGARNLQRAFDNSGFSYQRFLRVLNSGNIDETVAGIEKLATGGITEFPHLLDAVTVAVNTLDEASRLVFTESLVDSKALLGLTLPEQERVFKTLLGTLPPYAEDAATNVLNSMHLALGRGAVLPDDFLISELDRVLSQADKQFNSRLAEILNPGESIEDAIVRSIEESGFDVSILAQFDNVEDAITGLSNSPSFAALRTQLEELYGSPDDFATIFGTIKDAVDASMDAVLEFSGILQETLTPAFGDMFGEAQQNVLEAFQKKVEETSGKTAKTALELELLGGDDNIFANLEDGLKAVNAELEKLIEAAINRGENFNILEDSGLFTASEIQVLIEDVIPSLPDGVGDSILQSVADELAVGDVDGTITSQLRDLIDLSIRRAEVTDAQFGIDGTIDTPERLFNSLSGLGDDIFLYLRDEFQLTPEQVAALTNTLTTSIRESIESTSITRDSLEGGRIVPDAFLTANDVLVFDDTAALEEEIKRQTEAAFNPDTIAETVAEAFKIDPNRPGLAAAFIASRATLAENLIPEPTVMVTKTKEMADSIQPDVDGIFAGVGGSSATSYVDGFGQGLSARSGTAIEAARVLATSIKTTVDSILEISSPSRAAARSGSFFVDGLTEGILSNKTKAVQAAELMAKEIADVPFELSNLRVEAGKIEPGFRAPQQVSTVSQITGEPVSASGTTFHIENFNTQAVSTPEGAAVLLSETLKNLKASN